MNGDRAKGEHERYETWGGDGVPADDEQLARPFLAPFVGDRLGQGSPGPPGAGGPTGPPAGAGNPAGAPVHESGHQGEVRPYLLTGGRTRTRGDAVAMETVVLATGLRPVRAAAAAGAERARIVQLAARPASAAELAAWLHLPLPVTLVLVSDLVAEGLLEATGVATDQSLDVLFLERLIAGVAAL